MTIYYTKEHEWVSVDGKTATIGITAYAAEQLGDVVFVDLPEQGTDFDQDSDMAVVESVKAASDVYAPVTGTVVESNAGLEEAPERVNEDPEGDGWFVRLTVTEPGQLDGLMDADAYKAFLDSL
ncbi:MAG: glycine cleavage system protein GcvH [Pseudomonadota bacterium]